jgi:hypothetical protein
MSAIEGRFLVLNFTKLTSGTYEKYDLFIGGDGSGFNNTTDPSFSSICTIPSFLASLR